MLRTGTEIMNDIQQFAGLEPANLLYKKSFSLSKKNTKNFINKMLDDLNMPYTIYSEATDTDGSIKWATIPNLQPQKIYWDEVVGLDNRGEALYEKICEPFKKHGGVCPKNLKDAWHLFDADTHLSTTAFYRDCLLRINKGWLFSNAFCQLVLDLAALTAKYHV